MEEQLQTFKNLTSPKTQDNVNTYPKEDYTL
jgi:hypothetical protein